MRINAKRLLLGVGLVALSASAALAVPAVVTTDLNLRSGPGTNYAVVGSMPSGVTVDVGSCTGNWCVVAYGGEQGYASRSYLDLGAAGGVVVPAPQYGYVEPDYYYDDGYYAPGVTLGFGYYGGDRRHWNGRHHRGDWRGGRDGRGENRWGNRGRNGPVVQSPGPRRGQFSGSRPGGGTVGAGPSGRSSSPSATPSASAAPSAPATASAPSASAPGGGGGAHLGVSR